MKSTRKRYPLGVAEQTTLDGGGFRVEWSWGKARKHVLHLLDGRTIDADADRPYRGAGLTPMDTNDDHLWIETGEQAADLLAAIRDARRSVDTTGSENIGNRSIARSMDRVAETVFEHLAESVEYDPAVIDDDAIRHPSEW